MAPPSVAEALDERAAQEAVHLGDVGDRRRQAGADRPHRLVGDDGVGGVAPCRAASRRAGGATTSSVSPARRSPAVSPTQTMAASPARCAASALALTSRVALAMVGAALGMADDHGRGAGVLQHLGGDVAGVGAAGRGVAILAADREPGALPPRAPVRRPASPAGRSWRRRRRQSPPRPAVAHRPRLGQGGRQARSSSSCRPPAGRMRAAEAEMPCSRPSVALSLAPFLFDTEGVVRSARHGPMLRMDACRDGTWFIICGASAPS